MILRLAAVAVGVWLVAAPSVLGYDTPASAVDRIVGPIGGGVAFVALWEAARPLRRVNVVTGAVLVLAPLLGYDDVWAVVNSIACGALFVVSAFSPSHLQHRFGGGWSAVWGADPPHERAGGVPVPPATGA